MGLAALTCVGCGKKFEGDRELVPEFTSSTGIGAGGRMCPECFNTTNGLRSAAGYTPMPAPPAGAWGEYITAEGADSGLRSAPKRKASVRR
jgi:hypothetical protein